MLLFINSRSKSWREIKMYVQKKVPESSGKFWKALESSRKSQKALESSGKFRKVLESSGKLSKALESFRKFWTVPVRSRKLRKVLDCSKEYRECRSKCNFSTKLFTSFNIKRRTRDTRMKMRSNKNVNQI